MAISYIIQTAVMLPEAERMALEILLKDDLLYLQFTSVPASIILFSAYHTYHCLGNFSSLTIIEASIALNHIPVALSAVIAFYFVLIYTASRPCQPIPTAPRPNHSILPHPLRSVIQHFHKQFPTALQALSSCLPTIMPTLALPIPADQAL